MTDGGFIMVWKQKQKIKKIKNKIKILLVNVNPFNHVNPGEKAPLVGDLTLTCG